MKRLLLILLISLSATVNAQTIPSTFFSNTIVSPSGTDFPSVPIGMLAGTEISWPYIEQVKGTYNWTILDNYVSLAASKGVIMEYQTSEAPPWAVTGSTTCHAAALPGISACTGDVTDLTGWNDFLTQLTTRYNGNTGHGFLKIYELYIEPESFFTGAMSNLVSQTSAYISAVRTNSPTALVTGIGVTFPDTYYSTGNYMDQFWAAGGTKTMDAVSFHGYPHHGNDVPEIVNTYVPFITAALSRNGMSVNTPIWDTEGSWGDVTQTGWMVTDPAQQAAWVARSYLLHWSDGVSLYKWYAWDGYPWGALWYANSPPPGFSVGISPAGTAYGQVNSWMVGATMSTPCSASGTVWNCGLTKSGVQTLAVWDTSGNSSYTPAPQYTQYNDLAGGVHTISGAITIGNQPVLLTPPVGTGMPASCVVGTNVYYISSAIGLDSRTQAQARNRLTPWQHAPGMQNFTGSYSHTANDCFALRIGDTWPAASFGWLIPSTFASTYIGVDLTWTAGSAAIQPLFDLNNTQPVGTAYSGGTSFGVIMVRAANVIVDNLEIKRQFIKGGTQQGLNCGIYFDSGATNGQVNNSFLHDWVSDTANINAGFPNCAGGVGQNGGSYSANHTHVSGANSMDLTRGVQVSFGGCFQNSTGLTNSECDHTTQGALSYFADVHDNSFHDLSDAGTAHGNCTGPYAAQCTGVPSTGIHSNVIEQLGNSSAAVYNNLIYNNNPIGVTTLLCSKSSFYNNVMWNNASFSIGIDGGTFCGTTSANTASIYNNTVECNNSTSCVTVVNRGTALGTLNLKNNHWITDKTGINIVCINATANGCATVTTLNAYPSPTTGAVLMGTLAASQQNYNIANKFSPQSASVGTVNAGTNLTPLGITPLDIDVKGAFWFGGVGTARPANTGTGSCLGVAGAVTPCWNAGAYQFSGTGPTPPNAPTGLTSSVAGSTVSLSWTASAGTPVPTAYTLYRGTVHGGPYVAVQSGITATSTTDTPANGSYFYVVTAFVGGILSSVSGNGAVGTATCTSACSFPNGTTFTIGGNSFASFNNTFTSSGQPTSSTVTFSTSVNATGTGGGIWQPGTESAKSNEVTATVPATLTATFLPASRIFASQVVGTSSTSQTYVYTNTSGAGGTITISSKLIAGANPGDFSETDNCPSLLLSGLNCTFNLTFTPTAAGARSANLSVFDNASGSPHTVTMSGTGVAATSAVQLTPTFINFGDQTVSTTSTQHDISLQNVGTGTLIITSIVAAGDFAQTSTCGGTLAASAACIIHATFTPTVTGIRSGTITVTDSAAGSPHVVALQGNGIDTKCSMTGNVTLSGAAGVCQ